ncbi:MAG: hypothetical protein AAFO06_15290 [Cyanobacteria bacterium J06597_16]
MENSAWLNLLDLSNSIDTKGSRGKHISASTHIYGNNRELLQHFHQNSKRHGKQNDSKAVRGVALKARRAFHLKKR